MCATNKIRRIQLVAKRRFALMVDRIRGIQMVIEQRFAEVTYDPVGVEQIISRYDAINILSLRDELATEKFILSTNKIEKL